MRTQTGRPFVMVVSILALFSMACARSPRQIPTGWLSSAEEATRDAWGAWVRVERRPETGVASAESIAAESDPSGTATGGATGAASKLPLALEGELIAVGTDSLYMVRKVGLIAIAAADMQQILLQTHQAGASGIAAWTVVGTLSTASHGFYLVFTAPMWILGGTAASVSASHVGKQNHNEVAVEWPRIAEALQPHTRFPAGLPPGLSREHLAIKPARVQNTAKRAKGW